jgi:putative ATPase
MELFDGAGVSKEPLASRMRPRSLDEYIGQDHIVGKGRLLRRAIAADQLTSVIFYGPPGTGKTTLARVIAHHTKSNFITLNAVLTGVKDIREAIEKADIQRKMYSRKTILFVDEVHRWNKSQQDALLPWVENGTIILVGATTENPFFEVNKALVSRSRVFQLTQLEKSDLEKAARAALTDKERGYGNWRVEFEEGALEHLIETANGDARSLLNALELAVETTPEAWFPNDQPPQPAHGEAIFISREAAEESIQKKVVLYDRDGDYHYDIISAFIKSLRGRDPDAAMYWMARMVRAGEDPHFIFRRMLISACEDTGLADPSAIAVVESCARAFDRVGLPEGRYFLAHAALYLSTAPKSNSAMAFFDALSSVEKEDAEVPAHLKDDNRDAEGFGHGAGYMYPHAYRDHWVAQQYLPSSLQGRVFYTPSGQGYEKTIRDEVLSRREVQIAALFEEDELIRAGKKTPKGEQFTFTAASKEREAALERGESEWRRRIDASRAQTLLALRAKLFEMAQLLRHHRVCVWGADDGLLLWEALRSCPEGFVCGVCAGQKSLASLEQYGGTLDLVDRPVLAAVENFEDARGIGKDGFDFPSVLDGAPFDRILFRNILNGNVDRFARALFAALRQGRIAHNGRIAIAENIPSSGQRLARFLEQSGDAANERALTQKFAAAENSYAAQNAKGGAETLRNELFTACCQCAKESLGDAEAQKTALTFDTLCINERRVFTQSEISRWFSQQSSYGAFIRKEMGDEDAERAAELFYTAAKQGAVFERVVETALFAITLP